MANMATKKEYKSLTIPKLAWNKETLSSTYGELIAQPFEPGFGFALGGALRRILLGGVEGAAVTSVIIKGVNNEFAALPGVTEDVLQVALNCKEIIIQNKTGQSGVMHLTFKGPGVATSGDIVADEHLVVLNKEHVIAHVAQGGELEMTFFVESGRGYQPAQWPIGQALQEDGRIYLDAMFSPVRRVTYFVEKTRVGRDIDYDKLVLIVETDGTQTPAEVVHYAVSVLRTQLEHFLDIPEIPFNEISKPPKPAVSEAPAEVVAQEEKRINFDGIPVDLLLKSVDVLELSVRAHNCLINAGIKRILDLVNMIEDDVLKVKNFGAKSFEEVKEKLTSLGLSFNMDLKESDIKEYLEKDTDHEASS